MARVGGFDARSAFRTWNVRRPRLGRTVDLLVSDDPRPRILAAHLAAITAAIAIVMIQGPSPLTNGALIVALLIGLGLSFLRALTAGKELRISSMLLDAAGTAVFLAGTGAPASPFYALALAGVWWAAHLPRRHGGLAYALAFVAAYVVLIGPEVLRQRQLVEAFDDGAVILVVALLSDWFVRVDRRALELNEALHARRFGPEHLALREGLQRALGSMDVPLDVVLAASRLGLTAIQAELLSYLMLGLTNMEIADATRLSEAAVRYRLTRLYRVLGVSGRRQAADRARELGLPGIASIGSKAA